MFNSNASDILTEKLSAVISRCLDLFVDGIGGIDDFSAEYIVSGMVGLIKYYATHTVDNIEQKCLNFTKLHLGTIIDLYNES